MTSRIVKRKWGSGHTYALDGERAPGVTSILGKSLPKIGLRYWYGKEAARWGAANHELLHGAMDPDEWIKTCASAADRTRNKAADRGRSIHGYAEALLSGQAEDVPEELAEPVKHAARFLEAWSVEEIAAERPCANTHHKYAGSFDLIARLSDGNTWLLDYKTGGVFPESALQLAAYAECDIYQDENGNDVPMPAIHRLGVVALSDDGWELLPIRAHISDLFPIFLHCKQIAQFTEWTDGYPVPKWAIIGEPMVAS